MRYIYATVKERTKYQAVKRCIELEKMGYECIRKIQPTNGYRKHFEHNGKDFLYRGVNDYSFYEALYRREFR